MDAGLITLAILFLIIGFPLGLLMIYKTDFCYTLTWPYRAGVNEKYEKFYKGQIGLGGIILCIISLIPIGIVIYLAFTT